MLVEIQHLSHHVRNQKKPKKIKKVKGKRGRPKKGEMCQPKPKTKLQIQLDRTYEENITDIPTSCDTETKKIARAIRNPGLAINCMLIVLMETFR